MKSKSKIIASVAVVLLLAMAMTVTVFADAVQPSVSVSNASPNPGDTITFTITTNNFALMGNVSASSNLEFVSCSDSNSDSAGFIVAADTVTYTYMVKADAEPGSAFTFTATGVEGTDIAALDIYAYGDISAGGTVASAPGPGPEPEPEPEPEPRREIDFESLSRQNEDIIAWLEVPGTVIDYPVMSTTDNVYYLEHDETGAYSKYGAIFVDMSNPDDFSYPVMVAYGHYTPDEAYFTQLHRYKDPDYFEENREVYVYLPDVQHSYEIVAAMFIGEENILYEKDYTDKETMQAFVKWLKTAEDPDANINMSGAGYEDHYLVLSTCTQSEYWSDQRYIVVARLTETI